jgi:hypothetical protein
LRSSAKESGYSMKPFSLNKLSVVLLGLGGVLFFAPQSRAQSDLAPDHFDGTDSWAAAASAKAPATKARPQSAPATLEARNNKPADPMLQPVAARNLTAPRRSEATANKKRKPAAPKSNN